MYSNSEARRQKAGRVWYAQNGRTDPEGNIETKGLGCGKAAQKRDARIPRIYTEAQPCMMFSCPPLEQIESKAEMRIWLHNG